MSEPKVCEVTYKVKLEWADSASEEIAGVIASVVCCSCNEEDDDNSNNGNNNGDEG